MAGVKEDVNLVKQPNTPVVGDAYHFLLLKFGKLNTNNLIEIVLRDVTGRKITDVFKGNKPAGAFQVANDVSGLYAGTYIYFLKMNDGQKNIKFIKL